MSASALPESKFGCHPYGTFVKGSLCGAHLFTHRKTSCMDIRPSSVEPGSGSWANLFTAKAKASSMQAVKHSSKSKHTEEESLFGPDTSQMNVTDININSIYYLII